MNEKNIDSGPASMLLPTILVLAILNHIYYITTILQNAFAKKIKFAWFNTTVNGKSIWANKLRHYYRNKN